jgi:hypothetical protein
LLDASGFAGRRDTAHAARARRGRFDLDIVRRLT